MDVLKSDSRMRMIHFTKCQKIWWYFVLVKVNVQIVANAKKADSILKTCSRLLCKNCKCFTKDKEGEDEDIFLSQRYQGFLDDLSSDESSEEEEENMDSSIDFDFDFVDEEDTDLDEWSTDLLFKNDNFYCSY